MIDDGDSATRRSATSAAPARTDADTLLVPAARTWRGWVAAVRRTPWPFATLLGGVVVANAVLPQLGDSEVVRALQTGTFMVAGMLSGDARARTVRAASPATGAPPAERPRPPVDVRTVAPVPPAWRWTSRLGRWLLASACVAATLLTVCATFLVAALRDGSSPALFAAALLAFGCVVACAGLWATLVGTPGACRHLARHGTATVVRVLGVEHAGQRWHVQPVDSGDVVVLSAFRGRSRLVAGDVVHLWTAPARKDPYETRVAVTGPFGVLWPAVPDPADAVAAS